MKIEISRFFYGYLLMVWGGAAAHYSGEMKEPFWVYLYGATAAALIFYSFWQWWLYFTAEEIPNKGANLK